MKSKLSLEKIKIVIYFLSALLIGYSIGVVRENIKFQNRLEDLENQYNKIIEIYENIKIN